MARSNFNRKPNFLWQGLLIVLPVVVLAAVGIFSLRQDKVLAQHEATERAQAIADDLVTRIWKELTSSNSLARSRGVGCLINSTGHLVFPPTFDPVPQAFDSMMQRPDNFEAIAKYKYNDAVLLARGGKFQEAADAFDSVVEIFPNAAAAGVGVCFPFEVSGKTVGAFFRNFKKGSLG